MRNRAPFFSTTTITTMAMILFFYFSCVIPTILAKKIVVKNHCPHNLQVSWQKNDESQGTVVPVKMGGKTTLNVPDDFAGRVFARESCDIHDCTQAGGDNPASIARFILADASNPVSLAEFKMTGDNKIDYYDVSFVDGYNLPIRIEPTQMTKDHTVATDPRHCQPTFCNQIPPCPSDLAFYDARMHGSASKFVACQSACSRYRQDAYCCTGAHASPATCSSNHFSRAIKNVCPDVYTYPYDDELSVYACQAPIYTVTFCP